MRRKQSFPFQQVNTAAGDDDDYDDTASAPNHGCTSFTAATPVL
jgi:hypothetical protein